MAGIDADRLGTVDPGIVACLVVVDVVCASSSGAPTQIGGPLRVAQAACESKGSRGRVMWRSDEIGWMWAALEGIGISGLRVGREEKEWDGCKWSGSEVGAKLSEILYGVCDGGWEVQVLLVPTAEVEEGDARRPGKIELLGRPTTTR